MLFNSYEFMFFLPIVFLLYWFVFRSRKWQNLLVVVASYVFYGWWDWRFLFLIAFTSFCSYLSGILIERYDDSRRRRRWICSANIVLNLLILGVFKYFNFFADNLSLMFQSLFHYQLDWVTLDIVLPVGISFYTFQALSYTIDVYRKDVPVTRDIVEFFAFISFFPQLVAGPIERAKNLLPQFQRDRRFDYAVAVDGCRQMLWGFFKKLVIADNCATDLNPIWDSYADYSGLSLFLLAVLFTFQIYCGFSGYSDIAIGCARLFGINLLRNFDLPYFSRSIPEFWRRWHISLMTWFRDYIYFPLGGSRCSRWKAIRNVFIVFGVSGLWHGANWTFICWGLYHGVLMMIYNLLHIKARKDIVAQNRFLPSLKEILEIAVTFYLAVIGWVIFRATDISQAWGFVSRMVLTTFDDHHLRLGTLYTYFWIFVLIILEYLQRRKAHVFQFPEHGLFGYRPVRWAVYVFFFVVIFLFTFTGTSQQFIYFQF